MRGRWRRAGAAAAALLSIVIAPHVPASATGAGDQCSVTKISDDLVLESVLATTAASLSADGSILAYPSTAGLQVREVATGVTKTVPAPEGAGELFSPAISADGSRVAFVAGDIWLTPRGYLGQLDIYVYDRAADTTTLVIDEHSFNAQPSISADGRVVAASNWGTVVVADVDAGTSTRTTAGNDTWYQTPVSVSPDGGTVAFGSGGDAGGLPVIELLDIATDTTTSVAALDGSFAPRFLADGQRLVVTSDRNLGGMNPTEDPTLFAYDLTSGDVTALGPDTDYDGVVSPSGTHRVDASPTGVNGQNPEGNLEITSTDLTTDTTTQLTATRRRSSVPLASSASGDVIAFASYGPESKSLYLASTCDPPPQPDAAVATARVPTYVGGDVFAVNATSGQRATATIRHGGSRSFLVRLQNDRTEPDTLQVTGQDAGRPGFEVRYRFEGADVTATVRSGTFTTGPLDPGASATLQIKITARAGVPRNAGHRVDVTVRSATNPVAGDTVRAKMTTP